MHATHFTIKVTTEKVSPSTNWSDFYWRVTMVLLFVVLLLFFFTFECPPIWMKEIEFDRVSLNSSSIEDFYKASIFRVNKFNHTAYALNVDADIFIDVDENFEVEVIYYYKRLISNEYSKSAIHVPRSQFCKVLDKFYPRFAMEAFKDHSNLPQYKSPDKFCPLKKVKIATLKHNCDIQLKLIFFHFFFFSGPLLGKGFFTRK